MVFANLSLAIPLDGLDDSKEWRVDKITLTGNRLFAEDVLRNEMLTKERPWYQFWADRPVFEAVTFENDLERLRRYYEARGYYGTRIDYDLTGDDADQRVVIALLITEGKPVFIATVDVGVAADSNDAAQSALPAKLPVQSGALFDEAAYQDSERILKESYLRSGFAHVETTRKAEVNPAEQRAQIEYKIKPGPLTRFGATTVGGKTEVAEELIRRELAYRPGEQFSSLKIAESRAKLLALDLFSSVRIGPAPTSGQPEIVPMAIEVADKPHREIKLGAGYSTEEELRGQIEWRHLNWLGGGRQVSVQAKYSALAVSGAAELVQPHFFTPRTKAVFSFKQEQQKEDTFNRDVSRFAPRIDHRFTPTLSGFVGFRVEYDNLFDIAKATEAALGDLRKHGLVSGPTMGLVWNTTNSPFTPTTGAILALTLEQAGVLWGGDYRFIKISGEAKRYYEIGWDTVFAARLKLGLGDAIGAKNRFPLFERFYAGGENSVRGYGRRRLGPLSDSNDPLGGLSLLEGSVELRRPIWRELGGALFVDFGQLAPRPFDVRIANLNFAAGFGLSYKTPVGPVRLDIGFPFQKPPKDKPWQIHFSIGAFF